MTCADILRQFHVCQILFEQNATQIDLARLTACSKAFDYTRKRLFYDTFTLRLCNQESYEFVIGQGARRVFLLGEWIDKYKFDFTKKENGLLKFVCPFFNQPVASFGSLIHFECRYFNQPIKSFDLLQHFESWTFNQAITSFNFLTHFDCTYFNRRIASFDSLRHFESANFDQSVNSFDSLTHFVCVAFNRPIKSFDSLQHFESRYFNQPIKSFDSLKYFNCFYFKQAIKQAIESFGLLVQFGCQDQSLMDLWQKTALKSPN